VVEHLVGAHVEAAVVLEDAPHVALLVDDPELNEIEEARHFAEDALHAQLERRLGALELIAAMLELLDLLDQPADVAIETVEIEAELLGLVEDVGAAREIGDQHPLAVADQLRIDVLVGLGVLAHGGDVHAALVGEGALADEGLALVGSMLASS
jgi:hypothetical protein